MATEIERFNKVQNDYMQLMRHSLARWDSAIDDLRHRRGSLSGLISDAFASWMDVATFSLSLLTNPPAQGAVDANLVRTRAAQILVSLAVKKNQRTASASKAVDLPPDTQLKSTSLTRTDTPEGSAIPAANVKAHVDDGGKVVVVQLVNLKKVQAGNYRGALNDQNDSPVASIMVTVD
jgi:hypothetical protein